MSRIRLLKLALSNLLQTTWRRLRGDPVVESWPFQFEWLWGVMRQNLEDDLGRSAEEIRRSQEGIAPDPARDVTRIRNQIGGVDCEWFLADSTAGSEPSPGSELLFYVHGGGYIFGTIDSYADLQARLAHRTGLPVLGVDYRRCPEHDLEDAVRDVVSVLEELYERGWRGDDIVVAGDSAGGGLTVSSTMKLRDRDLPLPAALALISPWVDLRCEADSLRENSDTDYLTAEMLESAVEEYILEDRSPDDPLVSPVCGDLSGLPPTLIHAGGAESLLDDSRLLADELEAAGVAVDLKVWPGMVHVFHNFSPFLDEADQALDELANFIGASSPPIQGATHPATS